MTSPCLSFATLLLNCYSGLTHLYIGGETILANEGVTQGDPLAMPFYAISKTPLINRLPREVTHADDAAPAGSLVHLKFLWVQHIDTFLIPLRQRALLCTKDFIDAAVWVVA